MNTMSPAHTPFANEHSGDMAERVAHKTDDALVGAKRMAANAAQSVQSGIDDLRDRVPGAMSRAAAQAEDLTRRGLDRARETADVVRHRAADLGDATKHRIQDEPVKAVLIAAAVGAAATLLVQWLSRPRHPHRLG
jgi:ElaB/YqjD/DUF883 family membrane-anchored ribosome-binding protein